jgi:hypothetical protein
MEEVLSLKQSEEYSSITPAILTHNLPIGKKVDYFHSSGPNFDIKESTSTPIGYYLQKSSVVAAAYDTPFNGRAIVISGNRFISRKGYSNTLDVSIEYQSGTKNDIFLEEVIDWLLSSDRFLGRWSLDQDDSLSINLFASINDTILHNAAIVGYVQNLVTNKKTIINDNIPQLGQDGWYNFSILLDEGYFLVNFTLEDNGEYYAFEVNTDKTKPIIGLSGVENNTVVTEDISVTFWFYDEHSEIDTYKVDLLLDSVPVGYNLHSNETNKGFYLTKLLYYDELSKGSHTLKINVQDLAGNKQELNFAFLIGDTISTTVAKKSTGFSFIILIGGLFCILKFYGSKPFNQRKKLK